jgi:tetratricopeptide (TPR) repeat protein
MRVGETAQVKVTPPYGFGPSGSFSFPAVPPDAHLLYEVHLLAAEPPDEGKPMGMMLFEERLEASARRRAAGNEELRRGNHDAAASAYSLALSFIDDDLLIQLEGRHAELAEAELRAARLNLAAAHLGAGRHREVVDACDAVLSSAPSSCPPAAKAKALYRRGLARRALGAPGDAVSDFRAAAAAAPGDPAIRAALAGAAADARAQADAGAAMFRGALRQRRAGAVVEEEEEEEEVPVRPSGVGVGAAAGGAPRRRARWSQRAAVAAAVVVVVAGGLLLFLQRSLK